MKVFYDHAIFEAQAYGGISRYFAEVMPRIAGMEGVRSSACTGLHVNRYGLMRSSGSFEKFWGWKRPRGKVFSAMARMNPVLTRRCAASVRPDVYHLTTYVDHLPGVRTKRVMTLHDLIRMRMNEGNDPNDRVTPTRERVLAMDGVICVSEKTRADAEELLGLPRERTAVIYHANSLTLPAPERSLIDGPYLLYVGHRGGYKNFAVVLRGMAASKRLCDGFRLVCFGPAMSEQEHAEIGALGLKGRVVMEGRKDDATLAGLYAHAAALVCPSLYEGFGMPLLEAMHYGCPVVAARASCFPEIAGDAAAMFEPTNEEDLAQALERVLYDSHERSRLIAAGRAREGRFTWEKAARETVDFYRRVLGRSM